MKELNQEEHPNTEAFCMFILQYALSFYYILYKHLNLSLESCTSGIKCNFTYVVTPPSLKTLVFCLRFPFVASQNQTVSALYKSLPSAVL